MKLLILGSSASTPKINKYNTSQLLRIKSHYILIDCGEGTQMQLRKLKISFQKSIISSFLIYMEIIILD